MENTMFKKKGIRNMSISGVPRVLFLRSNPVAPDSRVEKEVESLIKNGYEVNIFCWDRGSNYRLREEVKVINTVQCKIYRVGILSAYGAGFKKNIIPLMFFQIAIGYFLVKKHAYYDIVHACDFDTCFTANYFAKKYGLKLVYDIFDYYVDSFNVPRQMRNFVIRCDEKIMQCSDAVIICSEERKKQIGNIRLKNLYVIHNTPRRENLDFDNKNSADMKNSKVKIVYVGILNEGRMLRELLNFTKKHQEFELHIAGFGKLESLILEHAGQFDNIHYYGRIEYKETLKLENMCDIMTALYDPQIPNHVYAAPNKFYEALFLGKPLIMVKGTGFSGIVHEKKLGVVIDYNMDSLEKGLLKLRKKSNEWEMMSKNAKCLYNQYYSWDIMENRLLALYKSLQTSEGCKIK